LYQTTKFILSLSHPSSSSFCSCIDLIDPGVPYEGELRLEEDDAEAAEAAEGVANVKSLLRLRYLKERKTVD
jgi:hypothetical protein